MGFMKYTDEMREFIMTNYKGIYSQELADRFNDRFGTQVTASQMNSYRKNHHLVTGLGGKFPKGNVPANKGKKMPPEIYEKCKGTMFKKGQLPVNYRPVGSERFDKNGYIEVKVKDPRTWKHKHRAVWEKEHGSVPNGHALIFLDGDKTNCELSNLKLVKRSELLIMNRYHLFQESAELNEAAANLAKVMDVTRKKGTKKDE